MKRVLTINNDQLKTLAVTKLHYPKAFVDNLYETFGIRSDLDKVLEENAINLLYFLQNNKTKTSLDTYNNLIEQWYESIQMLFQYCN